MEKKYTVGFRNGSKITISQEVLNSIKDRFEYTDKIIQSFSDDDNCLLIINMQDIVFIAAE